jgi:hypothetical protein
VYTLSSSPSVRPEEAHVVGHARLEAGLNQPVELQFRGTAGASGEGFVYSEDFRDRVAEQVASHLIRLCGRKVHLERVGPDQGG